ncbi:hypothetical protein KI387_009739, partial [Taxus chinensis]
KEGNEEKGKGITQSVEDHRKVFSNSMLEFFSPLHIKEKMVEESPSSKVAKEKDEDGFTLVTNRRKSKFLSKSKSKVKEKEEENLMDLMKGRKIDIGNFNVKEGICNESVKNDLISKAVKEKEVNKSTEMAEEKTDLDASKDHNMDMNFIKGMEVFPSIEDLLTPIKEPEEKKEGPCFGLKNLSRENLISRKNKIEPKGKKGDSSCSTPLLEEENPINVEAIISKQGRPNKLESKKKITQKEIDSGKQMCFD